MSVWKFLVRRAIFMMLTFVIITAVLYGVLMLAPVEARATLYLPRTDFGVSYTMLRGIIEDHGLDDPYPVQYVRWLGKLLRGDWGWSPALRDDVLTAMLRRTPVTAELTLWSVLVFIPLGILSGAIAAWQRGRTSDHGFRLFAFIGTSIPPFILGLMLLAIFYVGLRWFPVGRLTLSSELLVKSAEFKTITGLLVVDSLLNGRPDITLDALRHLILPVFTLSLTHWATLGRVTRAAMLEELHKDYINTARGKGLSWRQTLWRHALRNAMLPALNSAGLSAASLVTGVFVVEVIFALPGVSAPLSTSTRYATTLIPDITTTMGFAVYGILLVLPLMFILDVLQMLIDPRLREEVLL
jgi:peptide/nickel transport system permease protein